MGGDFFKAMILGKDMLRFITKSSLIVFGIIFLLSLEHIGSKYANNFKVQYGTNPNMFGFNEGIFYFFFFTLGGIATLLFALALHEVTTRWVQKISWNFKKPWIALLLLVTLGFILTVVNALFVLNNAPMTDDEHAYLLGAQIFSEGFITYPGYPPFLRGFFDNQFVINGERIYTQYFPGFMLALVPFVKLGQIWLIKPVMAALGLLGTYLLGARVTGSNGVGFVAALLLFLSPSFIYTSATLFSHSTALALGAFGLYFVWRCCQTDENICAFCGAFLIGWLFLTRPISGVAYGGAAILLLGFMGQGFRKNLKPFIISSTIFLGFLLLLFFYQYRLSGDPFKLSYQAIPSAADPLKIFYQNFTSGTWKELYAIPIMTWMFWLFGWPCSFLLLPFVRQSKEKWLLFAIVIGIWLAHLPWRAVGVNIAGSLHYYEAICPLVILSALGLKRLWQERASFGASLTLSVAIFSTALALFIFHPWANSNISDLAKTNNEPYLVEKLVKTPAVIFTKNGRDLRLPLRRRRNTWTFFRRNNHPNLKEEILWLNNLGRRNMAAIKYFHDRNHYFLVPKPTQNGRVTYDVIPAGK